MSFFTDLGSAVGQAFCVWLGGVGAAESWLQRAAGLSPGGIGAGIRGALCDDPTPPPPTPPPFTGGQCVGVSYNVTLTYKFVGNPPVTTSTTRLGAVNVRTAQITNPNGSITNQGFLRIGLGGPNPGEIQIYSSQSEIETPLTIVSAVRTDGNPDTCGDPAPIIPEFEPPVLPITVPDPDGGPNIDLDLTIFAPIVIGPNVFAPIRIEAPDINFNGTINLNPEFGIEIGSGLGGGGGSGTNVEPNPDDFDPESPDEPPQADGRRIIGLIVNLGFSSSLRATELAQDGDIESIYVPRAAIAYLISNNGGVRIPLSGVDLKLSRTYVPVPPDVEVVSWRIHTEPGVSVTSVRPVYGSTRPVN